MDCTINDLKSKEVIDIDTGDRLGFVHDVEIDVVSGRLVSLVVPGAYKFMGLFGRESDNVVKWEHIKKIGEDIILIESTPSNSCVQCG
ncbi:MAG: YlmC/YmxH family sporulation protein [Oscillospiraceae bacterium]|nr:YlmC/YmxH family sporulation protein [Oscillospiraceae bacterium]